MKSKKLETLPESLEKLGFLDEVSEKLKTFCKSLEKLGNVRESLKLFQKA